MDRENEVLESIRKLISLKVERQEIIQQLVSIGLSKSAAEELITKAEGKKRSEEEEQDLKKQKKALEMFEEPEKKTVSKPKIGKKTEEELEEPVLDEKEFDLGLDDSKEEVAGKEEPETEDLQVEKTEPKKEIEKIGLSKEEKEALEKAKRNLGKTAKVFGEEKELFPKKNVLKGEETGEKDFWGEEQEKKLEEEIGKALNLNKKKLNLDMKGDIYEKKGYDMGDESIWKDGILETVDYRLDEMKRLKLDIESEIEKKVDSIVEDELRKLKVVIESERDFSEEKINNVLGKKVGEIEREFVEKIRELKDLLAQIKIEKAILENTSVKIEDKIEKMKDEIEGTEELKETLLSNYGDESGKLLQRVDSELVKMRETAKSIEKRASITLNLQQKIAEGLENNVKTIIASKVQEAVFEIKKKYEDNLKQLIGREREQEKKVYELIEEMDVLKKKQMEMVIDEMRKVSDKAEARIEDNLTAEFSKRVRTMLRGRGTKAELKEVIKESVIEIVKDEVKDNVNSEIIESVIKESVMKAISERMREADRMLGVLSTGEQEVLKIKQEREDFSAFEKQFSETVRKHVEQFNNALGGWRKSIEEMESRADMKIRAIDNEIKKMERFERELAEVLEELIKKGQGKSVEK